MSGDCIRLELRSARPVLDLYFPAPQELGADVYPARPGPPGPPGPPGASGAGITYTQTFPSATWTVAHNIGSRPAVSTFSVGGVEMMGTVTHLSTDVVQIDFSTPVAGTARIN
jgi:hypothetical protein